MNLFLKRLAQFACFCVLGCIVLFLAGQMLPAQYTEGFAAGILDKYELLKTTDSPRIILNGGSSMAFGMDSPWLREKTGRNVVNLGHHAGTGVHFALDLAKDDVREGDIVILGFEYTILDGYVAGDTMLMVVENHRELYKAVPFYAYGKMLRQYPVYFFEKLQHVFIPYRAEGVYLRSAFNEYGDLALPRGESLQGKIPARWQINQKTISDDMIRELNEYTEYVEARDGKVYITFQCAARDAVKWDVSDLDGFVERLQEELKAEVISDPEDYFMDQKYFYDTESHCNTEGAHLRTERLYQDMIEHGVLE